MQAACVHWSTLRDLCVNVRGPTSARRFESATSWYGETVLFPSPNRYGGTRVPLVQVYINDLTCSIKHRLAGLAMHRTPALFFAASNPSRFHTTRHLRSSSPPIVQISNGTFYRQHPSFRPAAGQEETPNPALFPGLTFSIPSSSSPDEHWAILSPSSTLRTAFLEILRGQWLCFPPTARSFPYLLSSESRQKNGGKGRSPEKAIEYVGFDVERRAFGGAYLSARYESRVESTDFTLSRYLTGITSMNPGEEMIRERTPDQNVMLQVVRDLELEPLFEKPVSTLSNGQSRRARIGKSLLARPELLCLDAPFSKFLSSQNSNGPTR